LWGPAKSAVLAYHVERAIAYGRKSDSHSAGQATGGIYSRRSGWIRGPVGVSRAHYHRINKKLEKDGLLTRTHHTATAGDSEPTEFTPNFVKIRAALDTCKDSLPLPAGPSLSISDSEGSSHGETTLAQPNNAGRLSMRLPLSHPGTTHSSHSETHSEVEFTQVDFYTSGVSTYAVARAGWRRLRLSSIHPIQPAHFAGGTGTAPLQSMAFYNAQGNMSIRGRRERLARAAKLTESGCGRGSAGW